MIKKILLTIPLLALLLTGCASEMERRYLEGRPNVYKMLSPDGRGGGTGFILNHKGRRFIVTNRHVCELANAQGIIIAENDGVQIAVRVIKYTMKHDLCLVSSPSQLGGFELADREVERGETLYVNGHPSLGPFQITKGNRIGEEMSTVAYEGGLIDGTPKQCSKSEYKYVEYFWLWYCVQTVQAYQMNAYAAPGSSGSPVLNSSRQVVGVVFAGDKTTNVGLYVPLQFLREFLE